MVKEGKIREPWVLGEMKTPGYNIWENPGLLLAEGRPHFGEE